MSGKGGGPVSRRDRRVQPSKRRTEEYTLLVAEEAEAARLAAEAEVVRLAAAAEAARLAAEAARLAAEVEAARPSRALARVVANVSGSTRHARMEAEEFARVKAGIDEAILNAVIAVLEEESGSDYNVPSVVITRPTSFVNALKRIRKDIINRPVHVVDKVQAEILSNSDNRRIGSIASTEISRGFIRELLAGEPGQERVRRVILRSRALKLPVNARGGKRQSVRHRKSVCRKTAHRKTRRRA